MNRQRNFQARFSHRKWLAWLFALALAVGFVAPARATDWEERFFFLAGECYHLAAPTDWGPFRGRGENRVAVTFSEGGRMGALQITATRLEDMKASLEKSGVSVADWLIGGVVAGDEAAMFAVAQMAKAAGFQAVAVETVGTRKALVYETVEDGVPTAAAVWVEKEAVVMAQLGLEGQANATLQRELVRQVIEGFAVEPTITHTFGKQQVRTPLGWEFTGTDGNAAIGWRVEQKSYMLNAVACVVRLSKAGQPGRLTGTEELSKTMQGMLEKMLSKLKEAGLTQDDGLVRLYDCSEPNIPLWVAVFVDGDAALLSGVWSSSVRGGGHAREAVEQLTRGMEAMDGRTVVTVAGD